MKILMVGPNQYIFLREAAILEKLGQEVLILDERREYLLPANLSHNRFLRKIIKKVRPLKVLSKRTLGLKILNAAKKFKPDLLYLKKGMLVTPDTLLKLKDRGVKIVNWFPDDLQEFDWVSKNAGLFDYFFSFDTYVVEKLRGRGLKNVFYLPFAADPTTYTDISFEDKYKCDVAFVGAWYPEREKLLELLTDYNLKIWGWKNWEKTKLSKFYYGPLPPERLGDIYNNSKINLNIHFSSAGYGANERTFEIPAAGGFELSSYRKDMAGLFEIGKEIDVFKGPEEMLAKVDFYLKNDKIRQEIKTAGHQRVLKEHTYESRLSQMLKIITNG